MERHRSHDITDAAERLFSAQGYHATSVRQLAGAVNLQGGSLYAHFGSKEELLAAVVDRAADEFHAAVEPVLTGGGPVLQRLRAAIRAHVGVIAGNPEAATVYFHDWRHLSSEHYEQVRQRRNAYEQLWRHLIAEGVASGALRPVDPALGAIMCLSLCNWLYQWYDPAGAMGADAVGDAFAECLISGLVGDDSGSTGAQPSDPQPADTSSG